MVNCASFLGKLSKARKQVKAHAAMAADGRGTDRRGTPSIFAARLTFKQGGNPIMNRELNIFGDRAVGRAALGRATGYSLKCTP
jgi:hypothetical protein